MDLFRPSGFTERIQPEYAEALQDALRDFVKNKGEALHGDEAPGEELQVNSWEDKITQDIEEVQEVDIRGEWRRVSLEDNSGNLGVVKIALYDEAKSVSEAEAIKNSLGLEVPLPIGHIEFHKDRGIVGLDGAFYISAYGPIYGVITCNSGAESDQSWSEESEACYDFARQLGVDEVWVKHLYSGDPQKQYLIEADNRMAENLGLFLRNYNNT